MNGRSGGRGAAIQGGVLAGEVKDVLLLDVTRCRWASKRWAAWMTIDPEEHDDPDQGKLKIN